MFLSISWQMGYELTFADEKGLDVPFDHVVSGVGELNGRGTPPFAAIAVHKSGGLGLGYSLGNASATNQARLAELSWTHPVRLSGAAQSREEVEGGAVDTQGLERTSPMIAEHLGQPQHARDHADRVNWHPWALASPLLGDLIDRVAVGSIWHAPTLDLNSC